MLMLAPVGCGNSSPMNPTRGEVFFNGQPAAGASIVLHPLTPSTEPGTKRYFPSATVGPDGSFQLSTDRVNDGAPTGDYAVTIVWQEEEIVGGEKRDGSDKLGWHYWHPSYSNLRATIKPGNNELPRYDLK
jgi:hypothetical protein